MADKWVPKGIHVFCTINNKHTQFQDYTVRIGQCDDECQIAPMIEEDRRAARNTFGGLIEAAGSDGRTYAAFRAHWTRLTI